MLTPPNPHLGTSISYKIDAVYAKDAPLDNSSTPRPSYRKNSEDPTFGDGINLFKLERFLVCLAPNQPITTFDDTKKNFLGWTHNIQ